MEFGWINLFGAAVVLILLAPNVLYALKRKDGAKPPPSRVLHLMEQAGRYGCVLLMWLPLFVWKFAFSSVAALLAYLLGNGLLLLLYLLFWILYAGRKTAGRAMALAIIPACIFLLSGLLLRHWALVFCAVLFGVGHAAVTRQTLGRK